VQIVRSAERQIETLPERDRRLVLAAIQGLALEPRPYGCRKMKGSDSWRLRVGRYRIIYDIDDFNVVVLVLKVGHRKDVYR
jgi:mRNA interferase RelE/StbE